MKKLMKVMTALCCAFLLLAQSYPGAQTPGQAVRHIGVIVAVDPAARRMTIKTDAGPETNISYEAATRFFRVAPGAKDLENAVAISASDLDVGDRILARGASSGDASSFVATSIIVMSKADIAKKHAAERAEWEKRGVGGVITALNPAAQELTINLPTNSGAKPMVITFAPGAVLRRYAPSSIKFSDARPSRFEELQVGDQVKALGTSNEDRSRLTAEQLVSGSFRTIAGSVVSSDPSQSHLVMTDLATNKRVHVEITADSIVRRLSAGVAQMLIARLQGGRSPAPSPGSPEAGRPHLPGSASGGESSEQQRPQDPTSAIEKLPRLSLADVKPGEAVILACTKGDDPSRVTAITLLAGVEPVLRAASRGGRTLDLGSWNLDLSMGVGVP